MKKIVAVIVFLLFIFSISVPGFGGYFIPNSNDTNNGDSSTAEKISEKKLQLKDEGLEISGYLPVISHLRDSRLEAEWNARIQRLYDQKVEAAKSSRAKSISFSCDYKYGSGITSILLQTTTTVSSIKNEIDSFNFDLQKQEITEIKDILGANGIELASKVVGGVIKKDPDKYNPNFKGISTDQAFYVENGYIMFMFDEYQVASNGGIAEFSLLIDGVANTTVRRNVYVTKYDYELKMIPVRQVCEELGYAVKWESADQTIEIIKDEQFVTSISIGRNEYSRERMLLRTLHTLESAPELIDGVTYVPISFFDVILDMIYSVDDGSGSVMFTVYNAE